MAVCILSVGIFLLIVLGEHRLKQYVDDTIKLGEKKPICKNKIIFTKSYNRGAAFRVLEKRQTVLKFMTAILLLSLSVFFLIILPKKGNKKLKIGLALVLGGGVSNFWDRISFGHVIDYITFSKSGKLDWNKKIIFNLSDFCIFLGSIPVALYLIRKK